MEHRSSKETNKTDSPKSAPHQEYSEDIGADSARAPPVSPPVDINPTSPPSANIESDTAHATPPPKKKLKKSKTDKKIYTSVPPKKKVKINKTVADSKNDISWIRK